MFAARDRLLTWALAYLVAFGLAAFAATALDMVLGGFLFMLFGWSIGGGVRPRSNYCLP